MIYRCEILNHGIDGYEVWLHGRNQGRSGVKICSKVMMDIQSRVNFGWTKQRAFPKSCLCSIVKMSIYFMQSRFGMDKIKGLSRNHVFVQKSRWPYSMQSKFGMDKIQGNYKLE